MARIAKIFPKEARFMSDTMMSCERPRFVSSDSAYAQLQNSMEVVLKRYSNIHRGTGQHSLVATLLFEHARTVVLRWFGLDQEKYEVIFGDGKRLENVKDQLRRLADCHEIHAADLGLPLGVGALAVNKASLPAGAPHLPGGGTVLLVSRKAVRWAAAPDKFEAGTPNIVGVIALAKAITIVQTCRDNNVFKRGKAARPAAEILGSDLFPEHGKPLLHHLQGLVLGHEELVPVRSGVAPYIHLDNGSSTQTFRPVWEAAAATLRQPEPVLREVIDAVGKICLRFCGASDHEYQCLFTANTTDSIHVAAENMKARWQDVPDEQAVVVNTLLEHNSNELPWRYLPARQLRLPVDDQGFIDQNRLRAWLRIYNQEKRHGRQRIRLVTVSGVSNVLGTANDLEALARLAHAYQAEILVDAAQLAGHRVLRAREWDLDYVAFSGHKMYAPFGTGVLLMKKSLVRLAPQVLREIRQSGEANALGITALGKAMQLLLRVGMTELEEEEQRLTAYALERLVRVPGLCLYGLDNPQEKSFRQKGGVIAFRLGNVPHNLAAGLLAEIGGIGVRNGCFCAHLLVKRLLRIGRLRDSLDHLALILAPWLTSLLAGLVRVSLGVGSTPQDIDHLYRILNQVVSEKMSLRQRWLGRKNRGTLLPDKHSSKPALDAWARNVVQAVYQSQDPETEIAGPARKSCAVQDRDPELPKEDSREG
jgi:selenocysteine lyase/cysteine desulfurase